MFGFIFTPGFHIEVIWVTKTVKDVITVNVRQVHWYLNVSYHVGS